jgi:hypothetical protein
MREIGPVYVVEGQDKNFPPIVATVVREGSLYWVHPNEEEYPGLVDELDKSFSEPVTMSRAALEISRAYRRWLKARQSDLDNDMELGCVPVLTHK